MSNSHEILWEREEFSVTAFKGLSIERSLCLGSGGVQVRGVPTQLSQAAAQSRADAKAVYKDGAFEVLERCRFSDPI